MKTEKLEKIMAEYKIVIKKIKQMNNKTLQKALTIIDNADGVAHNDFFEIAELLLLIDKRSN
jgi:phosphate starvation-inducible protein PhoH